MKCHKLWKKSIRGGGSKPKSKQSTFQMQTNLTRGGGFEFFTFFPNVNIMQSNKLLDYYGNFPNFIFSISIFSQIRSEGGGGSSNIIFFPNSKQSTLSWGGGPRKSWTFSTIWDIFFLECYPQMIISTQLIFKVVRQNSSYHELDVAYNTKLFNLCCPLIKTNYRPLVSKNILRFYSHFQQYYQR